MGKSVNSSNLAYTIVLVIAGVVLAIFFLWPQGVASNKSFGMCLKESGVTMYGVDTCENCQRQKDILGDDFDDIHYVNCQFNLKECQEKGIQFYPVWGKGGDVLVGVQSLKELSTFSGCTL